MEALKARLKATWMVGDYGHFATYLEPGALDFLARLAVAPGTQMLDVACGAGQIAILAVRAGMRVTGIDIRLQFDRIGAISRKGRIFIFACITAT